MQKNEQYYNTNRKIKNGQFLWKYVNMMRNELIQNKKKDKKSKCYILKLKCKYFCKLSDEQCRFIIVFGPLCLSLFLGVLLYLGMCQFLYLSQMQDMSRDYINDANQNYLLLLAQSKVNTIRSNLQRMATSSQILGKFSQKLQSKTLDQLVSWQSQGGDLTQMQQINGKYNFLVANDFNQQDQCQYIQYFKNKIQQDPTATQDYYKQQYFGWSSPQIDNWSDLTLEQRSFLLKQSLINVFFTSMQVNQQTQQIFPNLYNVVRKSDSLQSRIQPKERLNQQNMFWYQFPYSDFSQICSYDSNLKHYSYLNVDQFDGFQNKDEFNQSCKKKENSPQCSCIYLQNKRLYPIDWRCRIWYQQASQNYYLTISSMYIDINSGNAINSFVFKTISASQSPQNIKEEQNLSEDSISSLDLNISQLIQNENQQSSEDQYSLIFLPSSSNDSDFKIFYHPKYKNQQNIETLLSLQFHNNMNQYNDFLEQVSEYMSQTQNRKQNCNFSQEEGFQFQMIVEGKQYFSIIERMYLCIGNIDQQISVLFGYFVRVISTEISSQTVNQINQRMLQIKQYYAIGTSLAFFFVLALMYTLLKYFLKYNFEQPLNILNTFIQQAKPKDIYLFYQMIQNQQMCTQYELKNLLQAINDVVIGIQTKVEEKIEQSSTCFDDTQYFNQIFQKYIQGLKTFKSVDHVAGKGLCYINIGNLYAQNNNFIQAIVFYQKGLEISEKVLFDTKLEQNAGNFNQRIEKMCSNKALKKFMNILASRRYLFGNALACSLLQQEEDDIIFDNQYNIQNSENSKMKINSSLKKLMKTQKEKDLGDQIFNSTLQQIKNQKSLPTDKSQIQRIKTNEFNNSINISIQLNIQKIQSNQIKRTFTPNSNNSTFKKALKNKHNSLRNSNLPRIFLDRHTSQADKNGDKKQNKLEQNKNNLNQNFEKEFILKRGQLKNHCYGNLNFLMMLKNDLFPQKENYNQPLPKYLIREEGEFNISIVEECIDQFSESQQIFYSLSKQSSNLYECYYYESISILIQLKCFTCQLIIQNKEKIVLEHLIQIKKQIKICKLNYINLQSLLNSGQAYIPFHIIKMKYYLVKGLLFYKLNIYHKSLYNLLKSLSVKFEKDHAKNSSIKYKKAEQEISEFYDVFDVSCCLKIIHQIIKNQNIQLNSLHNKYLNDDLNSINLDLISKQDIYFQEVFFKEKELNNLKRNTIFKKPRNQSN
ncbi:tetratricopeptide repeat protein (macronuclear) [Tetrahymena thermophila SB210]|uniref:Tetratricopeptide repeat protein n=1 Tax=Tetrahymena thermophila (strain SB210) TaxID=312017 RepID=Q22CL6_TETTS|nr:tetratricopeptide repeat protein [Tetrahymena thermophila SB210]EAR83036.2 tetratricopeptide repeat protein [Tetrahymena thermophila SB210]|eukprot:XP_001030699.2 tetratricopeptide repeat protein [Tetrahymena thermophila SB210]